MSWLICDDYKETCFFIILTHRGRLAMSMQLCIVTHVPLLGAKAHASALQNIIHESYVILDGLINDFNYCLIDKSSTYNDIAV